MPPSDRQFLTEALALLPAVAFGLRAFGLRRVSAFLSRHTPILPASRPADSERPRALGRLVNGAAHRLPGRPACLSRSVTLWWLLRRRGIDSAIRIGVRTAEGRFEAHAWVELGGVVLNDSQDVGERFAAFEGDTLPAFWGTS